MEEKLYSDLRSFLTALAYLKEIELVGPLQSVPSSSNAYLIGCRILLPLPLGKNNSSEKIMDEVDVWARVRNLERFGYLDIRDCPLLFVGLRKPYHPM